MTARMVAPEALLLALLAAVDAVWALCSALAARWLTASTFVEMAATAGTDTGNSTLLEFGDRSRRYQDPI